MKQGMRKQIKKEYFLAAIVLLAVIKQVIVSNIPLLAYETQMHDDALMFRMAAFSRYCLHLSMFWDYPGWEQ